MFESIRVHFVPDSSVSGRKVKPGLIRIWQHRPVDHKETDRRTIYGCKPVPRRHIINVFLDIYYL